MREEILDPQVKKRFYIKNLLKIIRLTRSNREKVLNFIEDTHHLDEPMLDLFEGTGGPMEEGMIYLLFDSKNGSKNPNDYDSVFRIFWILGPDLTYHQIDSFLLSTNPNLPSKQWRRFSETNFFKNLSKEKFHQEMSEKELEFTFDGTWEQGYSFRFSDNIIGLSGDLTYNPISPKGTLLYYNGREAVAPQLLQKFYDSFAIEVSGKLQVDNREIDLDGGRGIIEHGLGIFGIENIYEWRWLDLQGDNCSIHIFYHPLTLQDGSDIIDAGEGAALIDNQWYHFLIDDFVIEELEYEPDDNIPTKIPNLWNFRAGFNSLGTENQIDLRIEKLKHHSWFGEASGTTRHFTTNYFLQFQGQFKGEELKGRGTMEYLFERVIE